jgi:tetratricopeptide (TPR) repeat protein
LAPDSLLAHEGLLKFYIGAPGIIGGSINKAKKQAKIIAELNPAAGHFALGRIYFYEEEFQKAEVQIIKALAIDSNRIRYNFGLGLLFRETERQAEAVDIFAKIQDLNPIGPFGRINIWRAKYEAGRAASLSGEKLELGSQALISYMGRNVSSPNLDQDDWAEARLARIYQHQGKNKQAKELLGKLLANNPDRKLKRLLKKQLKQLKRNKL